MAITACYNPVGIALPYDMGRTYQVLQTWRGTRSHVKWFTWAVDFSFNFGDLVLSVGDGTVVGVRTSIPDGKPASTLSGDSSIGSSGVGNFITVAHDTFNITYCHFQQNGILFNNGDKIYKGNVIGYIGNTGVRTQTHLHVHVGTSLHTGAAGIPYADGWHDPSAAAYFSSIGQDAPTLSEFYPGDQIPQCI